MNEEREAYIRAYQREWIRKRRLEFFKDKQCVECGSVDFLELDHIDPTTKKYPPAQLWGMSDLNPNKVAELAKCQVLCSVCHEKKTNGNGGDKHLLSLQISSTLFCSEGHDLNVVGWNKNVKKNGFIAKKCSYCAHLTNARIRGGKVKSLAEWVEWRKTKYKRV